MNFQKSNIYIVGDTPRDIDAAFNTGVKAIGIATGQYGIEVLKEKNPTYLFNDLLEFKEELVNNFF